MSFQADVVVLARQAISAARALAESDAPDLLEAEEVLGEAQLDLLRDALASDRVLGDEFRELLPQVLADAERALAAETRIAVISHDTGRGGEDTWAYEEASEYTVRGHRIGASVRQLQALARALVDLHDATAAIRAARQLAADD